MISSLLRSLIRETLLLEEVYGAQAVVYHGTETDPQVLVSALLNDEFIPGMGSGSAYGKGLYTVYDLRGAPTGGGSYGDHVIKLKLNLYGYIIFDPDVALKVYKAPLSIVEQAQEIGLDEILVDRLRGIDVSKRGITSGAASTASKFLKGAVKGLIFTGENDGRVAVVYDPTTAVPIAWKNVRSKNWTQVDRESIKPALRRSASGDWQKEKYEMDSLKMLEKLNTLPEDKRVVKGNIDFSGINITSLPAGLKVSGTLSLMGTPITSLPAGLQVGGDLKLVGTPITSLPADLHVGGDLDLWAARHITSLPAGLQVGGDLKLNLTSITSLPAGLQVGGSLILTDAPITSLPAGLRVGNKLWLNNASIKSLPSDLQIGGNLYLYGTSVKSLPSDLQIGGKITGFSGDTSQVPQHLKEKLATW
jgi:hypothetical protein